MFYFSQKISNVIFLLGTCLGEISHLIFSLKNNTWYFNKNPLIFAINFKGKCSFVGNFILQRWSVMHTFIHVQSVFCASHRTRKMPQDFFWRRLNRTLENSEKLKISLWVEGPLVTIQIHLDRSRFKQI